MVLVQKLSLVAFAVHDGKLLLLYVYMFTLQYIKSRGRVWVVCTMVENVDPSLLSVPPFSLL